MIILSIITLIFSFLLQGIMSNFTSQNLNNPTWFITIYPLINLLILIPFIESDRKKIIIIIIIGLLIDIIYTNIPFLSVFLFIIAYYISKTFHFFFPYNLLTINISNLIAILIYHIITFITLTLLIYDNYGLHILLKVLSHSIIMTIIYSSIIYLLVDAITKKLNLKDIK